GRVGVGARGGAAGRPAGRRAGAAAGPRAGGARRYVVAGLKDKHPGVRRWAVRWAEPLLRDEREVLEMVRALADDEDAQVRLQVAYSLGECPSEGEALAKLARKYRRDDYLLAAVASSLHERNLAAFFKATPAADTTDFPTFFVRTIYRMAGDLPDAKAVLAGLCEAGLDKRGRRAGLFAAVGTVLDALEGKKVAVADDPALARSLADLAGKARAVAADPAAATQDRIDALGLLGR